MRFPLTVAVAAAMLLPAALRGAEDHHRPGRICRLESAAARRPPQDHRSPTCPEPNPDEAVNNTPHVIPRPADAWPVAPAGFKVTLYAGGDTAPCSAPTTRNS
jgi:hypothetical protein